MIKKLIVITLVVILSQATFAVHAGMHFPGTAKVDHSVFIGTFKVSGYGNNQPNSDVTVTLSTAPGKLTGLGCPHTEDPYDVEAPEWPINVTLGPVHPDHNGNFSGSFSYDLLSVAPKCGDGEYDDPKPTAVKGTLFATFNAVVKDSSNAVTQTASLGFKCNIDESVNASTTCIQLFDTHKKVK